VVRNLRKASTPLETAAPVPNPHDMSANRATSRLGLSTSEAARHLGVSLSTVRRWSDAGHLRGYRTPGGQRRFTVEQLDAFLDSLHSPSERRG
jgi:excisionase family DNA binding protein